jgi:glutaconate CoA-transferase, subunit B
MALPNPAIRATPHEAMVILGARALTGRGSVLVGIGQPNLAAALAKRLYARDLLLIYESGVIDGGAARLPLSIGDTSLAKDAIGICSMFELFAYFLSGHRVEVGFVGAAQVGRHGELNATVIGDYAHPTVRLPGSGGASDMALAVAELIVMIPHERRRFPETVDFVTSKQAAALTVITDLAVMKLNDDELVVDALLEGVSREQVQQETGWQLRYKKPLALVPSVTDAELAAVRDLDEKGFYRV